MAIVAKQEATILRVTVLDKYRITIPKEIREQVGIRKGQKMLVTEHNGIITLSPVSMDISDQQGEANRR